MDEKERCSFAKHINGVTYVVTCQASPKATLSYEELLKQLITREAMRLKPEDDPDKSGPTGSIHQKI